jgi:hypothetical protein
MLALDRRTRSGSHLAQALEVCEAALALQGTRQARIWRDLAKRRDRLAVLAANPPQPKKRVRPSQQRNRRPDPPRRFALDN